MLAAHPVLQTHRETHRVVHSVGHVMRLLWQKLHHSWRRHCTVQWLATTTQPTFPMPTPSPAPNLDKNVLLRQPQHPYACQTPNPCLLRLAAVRPCQTPRQRHPRVPTVHAGSTNQWRAAHSAATGCPRSHPSPKAQSKNPTFAQRQESKLHAHCVPSPHMCGAHHPPCEQTNVC